MEVIRHQFSCWKIAISHKIVFKQNALFDKDAN